LVFVGVHRLFCHTRDECHFPLKKSRFTDGYTGLKSAIIILPRETLTSAEQKQLKESNILVKRASSAAAKDTGGPWGIENPDHEGKPAVWLMPTIAKLIQQKADGQVRPV
jgi:hypothetical protein